MKKQFRILAAALALCLSLLCCPAAFAAVDSSSCQTVPYAQATSQPLGQPITITGTPNYSAATSNDTAFIFGFDTADGVWYVAVQKSKFDAFKAAAPAQQMTLYGVYAGTLDVNGMPILDIQNGSVLLNGTTSDTAENAGMDGISRLIPNAHPMASSDMPTRTAYPISRMRNCRIPRAYTRDMPKSTICGSTPDRATVATDASRLTRISD